MEESAYRKFFSQPLQTYHRRYEALRAVFIEGRSQKDVATMFGYSYGAMRQLVFDFRRHCDDEDMPTESLFFEKGTPHLASLSTTINVPIRR